MLTLKSALSIKIGEVTMELAKIVTKVNDEKEKELSVILETVRNAVSPGSKANPEYCPWFVKYGISLEDRRVHEGLLRDLITLNHRHEKASGKTNVLYCPTTSSKKGRYLVVIPSGSPYHLFKKYGRETKWIDHMLHAVAGDNSLEMREEAMVSLLSFI
jgi:hypothetical protein